MKKRTVVWETRNLPIQVPRIKQSDQEDSPSPDFSETKLIRSEIPVIELEETMNLGKIRKSGIDIIRLLAESLTEEEQLLYNLSESTGLDHGTIERYLQFIMETQKLFKNKTVHYKEQKIGKKHYKSGWITKE